MESVTVDPEFDALLPPLSDDEREELRKSILADGCRDPLIVWKGHGILLDGHNRFAICQAEGIEFSTRSIELADRQAAEQWIILNQLARRNLDPKTASYLRGRLYQTTKHEPHRPKSAKATSPAKASVSDRTIRHDAEFARAVDALGPDVQKAVIAARPTPPKRTVIEAAKLPPPRRDEAAKAIAEGKRPPEPEPAVIRDALGTVVTHPRAKMAFADAQKLRHLVATIGSAILQLRRLQGEPVADRLDHDGILIDLQNAKRKVRFAIPYRVVNESENADLRRIGWITELQHKQCQK